MKSIPIKKDLLIVMVNNFPEFEFVSDYQTLYGFTRKLDGSMYDHIIIQRDFYDGQGRLVITEAASCYNKNWRSHPCYTVGEGTDIAVLMTGKHVYDADTGWHSYGNSNEQLMIALNQIVEDIKRYVLPYFENLHQKLKTDKVMRTAALYLQPAITAMQQDEAESFKVNMNARASAYSEWRKQYKKEHKGERVDDSLYVNQIPVHPLIEHWLTEIREQLGFQMLKDSTKERITRYIFSLFRDINSYYI